MRIFKFLQLLVTIILVIFSTSLLTACGFGEAAAPTPPPEPVKLALVSFDNASVAEQALIDAFQASHPGITVERDRFRQAPDGYLTQDNPPDLLLLVPNVSVPDLIDQGLLTEITDIWEEGGFADSYPASLRNLSEREGKQYFLPTGYAWNGVYYNRAIFAQYGLQPPVTWDEFIALCEMLITNNEVPLSIAGRDTFATSLWIDYLNLRLNGVEFHRQFVNGEVGFTDSKLRQVFDRWQYLIDQGYVLDNASMKSGMESLTVLARTDNGMLGRDKAVMSLTGPVFFDNLPKKFRDELDFFAFPTIDPAIPNAEVAFAVGYVIPTQAAHRNEALAFLQFLASDEAKAIFQKDVTDNNAYVPALLAGNNDLPAQVQQGMEQIGSAQDLVTPYALNLLSNPTLFPSLDSLFRQMLNNPKSEKPIDMGEQLNKIEAARLK